MDNLFLFISCKISLLHTD